MGQCPCPRCLIHLSRVPNLGMPLDIMQRRTRARKDDVHHRVLVSTARGVIYNDNRTVDCKAVKSLLNEQSMVPTQVCSIPYIFNSVLMCYWIRMHFLNA